MAKLFFDSVGGGIYTKNKLVYNHSAIFSKKSVVDQINMWNNENSLAYDPFMRSGTTAKTAHLLDRKRIGSEISKEYVAIANERLKPNLTNDLIAARRNFKIGRITIRRKGGDGGRETVKMLQFKNNPTRLLE